MMYEMKKSRSLRIYAETPDLEEQTPRSKSARLFGEPLKSRQRPSFSERRSSHENEDFASGDNYGQKTSSERFFDVEISGALNADGAFRSRSQRVYLSELPDNLQSQIEQESERFSIGSPIEGSLEHAKSFSKYTDKKLDEVGDESTKDTKEEKVFETGKGARKKKVVAPRQSVPYLKLYKYADRIDYLLMFLGTVAALIDGLMWPAIAFIQSHLLNRFASLARTDPDLAYTKVASYSLNLVYVSIVAALSSYFEVWCWMYTGERQAGRIRAKYVRAILRQNVGYFDTQTSSTAAVVDSVSSDTLLLQDAISEKVGNTLQNVFQLAGGLAVGFYLCWRLALSILPFLPFLLLPGVMYGRALLGLAVRIQVAYGKAGTIAEQAISSIRTVYSFVGEKRTLEAFAESLESTVDLGKKQGLAKGLAIGLTGQTFLIWAFVCWYGTYQVVHGYAAGGSVVFGAFIILFAGLGLGSVTPNIKSFLEGRVAAYRIFEMIEKVPPIDVDDLGGKTLTKVLGNLEFRNVNFAYPSRLDAPIFQNFNIQIPAGKTIALVGSSGSGKSTVIALLERFYDPTAGQVLIDGVDMKELQLRWLRNQIGLVSQEPALFATSIIINIQYGKDGATMEEVFEAAKSANAHTFISQLPNGYDTQVGEQGVQMSGGQKQRIAIARMMLKKPPVLLLDEATSALDAESEKVVQQALEKAALARTTVVVAHRLSTVRNADVIAVLRHGKVVEIGSHEELLAKGEGGAYFTLINLQHSRKDAAIVPVTTGPEGLLDKEEAVRARYGIPAKRVSMDDQENMEANKKQDFDMSSLSPATSDNQVMPPTSFNRLLWLNKPEWKQGLLGLLGAIGFGFANPFFAYIVATLTIDYYDQLSRHKLWHNVREYAAILIALGFFFLAVNLLQHYNFAHAGEMLTKRVRMRVLGNLLQFEVGWFDRDENSSGSLCSRLSSDANMVRALIGDRISLVTGSLSMVVISWVICFIVSWRYGVLIIFLHPIIIFCYYIKKALLMSFAKETAIAQAEASQVASEGVAQHRTVTAYSAQEKVQALFEEKLQVPKRQMLRRSQVAGITFGIANFCTFGSMALLYWYGGVLSKKGQATFADFFRVFLVFVNTSRTIGEAGALTPDIAKASVAINSVFQILDHKTNIEPDVAKAEVVDKIDGRIELKDVYFAYPSRPNIMVFKGFSLKIQAGQTAAMVGQSGSGKSTIIGLLERFYDPLQGAVLIDGKDLSVLNLHSIRRHIGLVNQEPTLFAMSIQQNIAYGKEGATEAEIIAAACAANAHNFISGLPDGYATFAGDRGLQLSGGQKQRIAIARAILKNPKILLLDEATSALDAESERVVQDALDHMMVGRTTIVVAHRLSTIRNADSIAVLQDGVILEEGKHNDLLAKGEGGAYYSLVHLQTGAH